VAVAVPWSWPWAVAATAIVLGVASADLRSARRQSSTTCSLTLARAGRESTSLREHSVQSPGRVSAEKVRCRRYGRFNRRVPLSHPLRHWHRVSCTEAEAGDCANLDHAADPGSTNRRPICAMLSIGAPVVVAVSKSAHLRRSRILHLVLASARLRLTPHSGRRPTCGGVPKSSAAASLGSGETLPHEHALLLVHRGHEGASSALPLLVRPQLDRGLRRTGICRHVPASRLPTVNH